MVSSSSSGYERATGSRLKTREENTIRWVELLDKFKSVQEKARRTHRASQRQFDQDGSTTGLRNPSLTAALSTAATADRGKERGLPDSPRGGRPDIGGSGGRNSPGDSGTPNRGSLLSGTQRNKSGLPNLGRLGIGSRRSKR